MAVKSKVFQSQVQIKTSDHDIAAGDLSSEIGKTYMKRLWHLIDFHEGFKKEKVYFLSTIRKNPKNLQEINININAMAKPLTYLRESMDLWEYDYKKEKLNLFWSLPHRIEMKNFLRTPEKYSKDIIKWIRMYLKQEKLDLNDNSSQVIGS